MSGESRWVEAQWIDDLGNEHQGYWEHDEPPQRVKMKTEEEIRARMKILEDRDNWDEDSYLDEGEQAELYTLMWVLGEHEQW